MGMFDDLVTQGQNTVGPQTDFGKLFDAPSQSQGIPTPKGNLLPSKILKRTQQGLDKTGKGHPYEPGPIKPWYHPTGPIGQGAASIFGLKPDVDTVNAHPGLTTAGQVLGSLLAGAGLYYGGRIPGYTGAFANAAGIPGVIGGGSRFMEEAGNQGKPYGEALKNSITPSIVNAVLGSVLYKTAPWMASKGLQGLSKLAPAAMSKLIAPLGQQATSKGGIEQSMRQAYDKFLGADAASAVKGKGLFDDIAQGAHPDVLAEANKLKETNPWLYSANPFPVSQEARDLVNRYDQRMNPITQEAVAKGRIANPLEDYVHRAYEGSPGMMNTVMNKMPSSKARSFDTTEEAKTFFNGIRNLVENDPWFKAQGITPEAIQKMGPEELNRLVQPRDYLGQKFPAFLEKPPEIKGSSLKEAPSPYDVRATLNPRHLWTRNEAIQNEIAAGHGTPELEAELAKNNSALEEMRRFKEPPGFMGIPKESPKTQASPSQPGTPFGLDQGDIQKFPNWLGMKPLENPALSAGLSSRALDQANATEELANHLKGLRDEHGPIFDPNARGNPNYTQNYDIRPGLMDKHFYMGGGNDTTILGREKIPVRKEFAKMASQILGKEQNWDNPNNVIGEVGNILKTTSFYNPLGPHQINVGSNALQAIPGRLDIASGEAGKLVRENPSLYEEALKSGLHSPRASQAKEALRMPLEGEKPPAIPVATPLANKWRGVQNKLLWGHVEDVGLGVWKHYRDLYMGKGFEQEEAGRMASEVANDVIGMTSGARTPLPLRNAWLRQAAFIPQWLNTAYRKYAGAALPGQIFKSFSPEAQRALQETYAQNLGSGFNQAATVGNLFNKAASGHWAFENDKRNQPSLMNPAGTIETNWRDPVTGKVQTIGNPFFKHLSLPERVAKDMSLSGGLPTREISPAIRAIFSQLANKDSLTGRQLTYPGEPMSEKLKRRAVQFGSDINPLGIGNIVREQTTQGLPKWQRAVSTVLPTYLGETHGAGPGFDRLMQMNRQRNPGSWQGPDEPWVAGVDRAIQKGNYKQATQIAAKNGKDGKWYVHHLEKLMTPVSYSLGTIPGFNAHRAGEEPKGHDFFKEFWPKLGPEERRQIGEAYQREAPKRQRLGSLKESLKK